MATGDRNEVELGVRFAPTVAGTITGIRFYKGADQVAQHTVTLWDRKGNVLATANTPAERASGWQIAMFNTPVKVSAHASYTASYRLPDGQYAYVPGGLAKARTRGHLTAPANGGVYRYKGGFPTLTSGPFNYLVDVAFVPGT